MVFYKFLLEKRGSITGSMALVYSALLEGSIMSNGEIFDHDGSFNVENACEFIDDMTEGGYYRLEMIPFSTKWLSKKTEMTQRNVRIVLNELEYNGYISVSGGSIDCPGCVLKKGFMKLPSNTGLKGWQLIDYAYLKERASRYGGKIDTWGFRLAELLHTTTFGVFKTIERLKKKGFVERLSDGRLLVK